MQVRRRLRSRIVLSFLLFGTLLSVLFALSTLFLQNYLEDQLIGAAKSVTGFITRLEDQTPSVNDNIENRSTTPTRAKINCLFSN